MFVRQTQKMNTLPTRIQIGDSPHRNDDVYLRCLANGKITHIGWPEYWISLNGWHTIRRSKIFCKTFKNSHFIIYSVENRNLVKKTMIHLVEWKTNIHANTNQSYEECQISSANSSGACFHNELWLCFILRIQKLFTNVCLFEQQRKSTSFDRFALLSLSLSHRCTLSIFRSIFFYHYLHCYDCYCFAFKSFENDC